MAAILVHGGAGPIRDDDRAEASAARCLDAAQAGYEVLRRGGSALDAVVEAVRILEDDPLFNAGVGSALNADGDVELDAMVMEGEGLRAGAVGALRGFKNPIEIARRVLERAPHVLLVAEGAARFARQEGFEPVPPALLVTERAIARWERDRASGGPGRPGTVGAVAVDDAGRTAAATSTGGVGGKWAGRVGDTPLPGCGTYADDEAGAASATGYGESIMRIAMTAHAILRLAAGEGPQTAAEAAVARLARVHGEGGIIVVDRHGRLGWAANTERMAHAWVDAEGRWGSGFER